MLPKVTFAHLPTQVEALPRLTKLLGGPQLIIKRDDQTGLAFGGNKTRKLEYLMGAALEEGAAMVCTTGAAQSNHCRQTAAAAARCGIECTLVLVGPEPDQPTANLFLDQLLGAKIIWTDQTRRDRTLEKVFQEAGEAGMNPYLIPYGGSNAIGAYAYYQAFQELREQLDNNMPDWIVFASSSGGTQAGLLAGVLSIDSKVKILGISVDEPTALLKDHILTIIEDLNSQAALGIRFKEGNILVNDDYTGKGYGVINDRDIDAIHSFGETEGILLDPVYTGRAAGGMLDLIRKGVFKRDEQVLFWHTGGTPALFADKYLPFIY